MNSATFALRENLKKLKLATIRKEIDVQIRQAREAGTDYADFLLDLTSVELQHRTANRLKRRMREAKSPLVKTLDGFDTEAAGGLDLRLLRQLATCDYLKENRNIIFMGRSGTGKSHLATALGIEACRNDIRTRFVSCYGLVNELLEAREERALQCLLACYNRYELLILDELGYIPFSKEGTELLFQVLAKRHEKSSVIITTNLGFADWSQVFVDPIMTNALLDRLTHKAHIISCTWESYRLKQSLAMNTNAET
ncbi:IS21-like element helper ATPase IstB [Desulfosediminicola flagellatus]|uniref:IS21-like element helper ATPase IstB n=1 Tax=Desulfosediminicola flagellatus TaxID=2569541 RepID=UPI0010ABC6EF|nr:IS21-like element helper ATPase IstB [Desulfosediminicola flagellatus]